METEAIQLTPRVGADSGSGSLGTQLWMELAEVASKGWLWVSRRNRTRLTSGHECSRDDQRRPGEEGPQTESGLDRVTGMWRKHGLILFHELV